MNTLATQIRALRNANVRNEDIAAQLGITKGKMESIVKANNMPHKERTISQEHADKLRRMYMDGMTFRAIAQDVGQNENTVATQIRKLSLPPRQRVPTGGKDHAYEVPPERIKADPYAGVTGVDGELLRCGRNEAHRAVIAGRHGLTITQARIKWFRLMQEYGE